MSQIFSYNVKNRFDLLKYKIPLVVYIFIISNNYSSAQNYTTGNSNWTNVWNENSGSFSVTNGVAQFSFGSTVQGQLDGRFFTTDGTLNGTQRTVKPGQRIRIRIAGQDGGGRTGIVNDGIIGVSIKSGGGIFDGGTSLAGRYDNNSILKIEFLGGQSTARFSDGAGFSTTNMPNFTDFKSGTTYDIEVVSDREFNLVIGSNRNNIRSFTGSTGVSPALIHVRNSGANMDALFTLLEVSNMPINLTANASESFNVTGVISNNESTINNVNKNGLGTVTLTAQNTFTGLTTVNAGTLQLNRSGGSTLPATNDVTVNNGGTLRVSSNQTLDELTINTGGTLTVDAGVTLTINGTLTHSGTINGAGSIAYGNNSTLVYSGVSMQTTNNMEWPSSSGPNNVSVGASGAVLHASRTINGTLTLNGAFNASNNLTLGNTGSLIFNGGSISNFTLPTELQNYTLPSGTSSLSNNLTVSGTLTIGSATLDIGSNTLSVNGAVSRTSGFIRSNGGSINIGGSTGNISLFFDQTTSGTTNRLVNLTLNRASSTITIENEVQVTGTVTPTAGTLNANGNLVLISTASGTGRIAQIQTGAAISGNVNVQRFMQGGSGRRGWRMMASPINSFTFNQLQEDILITGPGGGTNGFDAATPNSSIVTYQESTSGGRGWKNIAHTNNALGQGLGMLVFYRGSRSQTNSLTNTAVVPNDTVMDYLGNINQGAVTVNLSYTSTGSASNDGWNLIGNPYPCEINYGLVTKNNLVSNSFWIWNTASGNYVNLLDTSRIAIGQGFFVQAASSGASVTFNESCKVSSNPTAYFKTMENPLSVKMYQDSTKFDIAWLHFKPNASLAYVFNEDAMKFLNSNINMGFVTSDQQLVQRNVVQALNNSVADTFVISTNAVSNGSYTIELDLGNTIPANKDVYLIDVFNNNITNVRLHSKYTFQIQNSNAATGGNRFRLVIGNAQALPVKLVSFSARRKESGNLISWTTAQEKNMKGYEVQYSADGSAFETIGYVQSKNRATQTQYVFDDNRLVEGYYRLNKIEFNRSEYSHVVRIDHEGQAHVLTIYPNPAKGVIHIDGLQKEDQGTVTIRQTDGKVKYVLTAQNTIDISALEPGLYFVEINTANGSLQKKLLVE